MRSRDSRRRRVLLDESNQANRAGTATPNPGTAPTAQAAVGAEQDLAADRPRRQYGFGAQRRGQPKTTDLIPKRKFAYTAMVVLLVCGVATINALAFYANDLQPYVGTAGVESFSLQGPGTLAAWCGALLMAVSAATCCQVYCLRKHRCDDYLGSYRVWSWLAVLFAVGSLSQSVDMVGIVSALIAAAAGAANLILPTVGGAPLMTLVGGLLFSIVAAICCWEVRRSRGSLILAATAWAAGMVAIAVTVPALNDRIAAAQLEPAFANGWLVFASCCFLAVVTYARHVYLAANGMVKVKSSANSSVNDAPSKPKVQTKPVPKAKPVARQAPQPTRATKAAAKPVPRPAVKPAPATKPTRAAAAKPAPAPTAKPAAARPAPQPAAPQPAGEPVPAPANLSKAERRRQRKLQRRANRAA